MDMNIDYDQMYNIPVRAMKFNRSHPETKRDKKWMVQFAVTHSVFTLFFCMAIYSLITNIKIKNFSEACGNGVIVIIFFDTSFQYFIMVKNQKTFLKIIGKMKEDFQMKNISQDERSTMLQYANKGKWLCKLWLVVVIYGTISFPIKHFIIELYYYISGDFKLLPLFRLTYPSFIEENKEMPIVYAFIYIILIYYLIYADFMYVAFIPLGPVSMLHACGQLEIVKQQASNLYVDETNEEVRKKLKNIVRRLQNIYSFVDDVKESVKVVYELSLKAVTIILPVACFEIKESFRRSDVSVEFIIFILGSVLISSVICYHSDMLMEKSLAQFEGFNKKENGMFWFNQGEEVRLAVYSCGWETRYDRSTRSTLALVLLRAHRPVAIQTLFRTVSLEALSDIFHQSYAIFNLINAAWK